MKCDRCFEDDIDYLTGSMFNTDLICPRCSSEERNHPDFQKARDAEKEAISKGEFNFPGIGLPDDLKKERKPKT